MAVDLERGVRRNGQLTASDIQAHIEQIRTVAQQEGRSQSCLERLDKTERLRAPLFEPGSVLSGLSPSPKTNFMTRPKGWQPYASAQVPMSKGETATCLCAVINFKDAVGRASGRAALPFTTFSHPAGRDDGSGALFRSEAALHVRGDIGLSRVGSRTAEPTSKSVKWLVP